MGLLKHFRSRSRLREKNSARSNSSHPPLPQLRNGPDLTKRLPDKVLANIFTFVCPHTVDYSYEPCEKSQIGDGCMLCDLRDLAQAAQACRRWYAVAQSLLYTSIRIDAVHYCELEETLAEKRKKAAKHFKSKSSVDPGDVPNIRLSLLCQTLRDNRKLGNLTLFLKLPYMTRETAKGDLARTVSACPSLQYVDLPEGFFSAEPTCFTLRQELQMRCHDIRKMTYRSGAEDALQLLTNKHWPSIEVLEICDVAIEPTILRPVLASLPKLSDLTLSNLEWLDDTIFQPLPGQLPDFPSVRTFKLINTPHITAQGLQTWLQSTPQARQDLTSLTLDQTGVSVPDLHRVLWTASSLLHLAILEAVSRSLTLVTPPPPALTSISLRTLHFEITNSDDAHGLQRPAESHYAYLASSLHQKALPALTTLYVRDQSFPELMLLLPPAPNPSTSTTSPSRASNNPFLQTSSSPPHAPARSSPLAASSSNNNNNNVSAPPRTPMTQTLEVFSKGIDELDWVFTSFTPGTQNPASPSSNPFSTPLPGPTFSHQRAGSLSGGRPLSSYSASKGLGPQWARGGFGGEARRSVMVGNGFGGFLAVPSEEVPRPATADAGEGNGMEMGGGGVFAGKGSGQRASFFGLRPPPVLGGDGNKRSSRHDLWR